VFKFKYIDVKLIDAESGLVSKAIVAPEKNKHLIRQAIASGKFPELVNRNRYFGRTGGSRKSGAHSAQNCSLGLY